MNSKKIIENIKEDGYRLTASRKGIVNIFIENHYPISAKEIQKLLSNKKISTNKTTVYREITFLKNLGIIREIELGEGKKRYEVSAKDHHHHLLCVNCEKIMDIPLEKDLDEKEKNIEKKTKFKILNHSLEFFGLCQDCQIIN